MNPIATIKELTRKASDVIVKNEPTIMSVAAMGGTIATGALAAKGGMSYATEKADKADVSRNEKIGMVMHHFWPAGLSCGVTLGLIFGANRVHLARNAALLALLASRDQDLEKYKKQVSEMFGNKKATEVHDRIAKEILDEHPVDEDMIINTNGGNCLCFDTMSGRYFRSSMASIQSAENEINRKMINEYTATLNDFYDLIGLDGIEIGEDVGWNTDTLLRIDFSCQVTNGQPCLVIDYITKPQWCFR